MEIRMQSNSVSVRKGGLLSDEMISTYLDSQDDNKRDIYCYGIHRQISTLAITGPISIIIAHEPKKRRSNTAGIR